MIREGYMVNEQRLKKFIDLYEKKYSIKLSRQEAFEIFSRLVKIIKIVNYPDPSPSFTSR